MRAFKRKQNLSCKCIALLISFTFAINIFTPPNGYAQLSVSLKLPNPGVMVGQTPAYIPALVKGITVHPENPLKFEFFIDRGDDQFNDVSKRKEYKRLIKYFLASLTVPEEDLWVNLSPNENDKIVPNEFGQTEMGRDLLAQDYILKQLMASLMYPEDELGGKFWNRVYEKAHALYGNVDIPIDTFHKVWIVPDRAVVFEQGTSAFVADSRLKVMLESDYNARSVQTGNQNNNPILEDKEIITQIIRDIIIPEIEQEVNEGKNFTQLRQIYNSLILAAWYKQNLKQSLLSQVYVDQKKISGVDIEDKNIKQKIYEQYMLAFKEGVYDYIKEDFDPVTQETTPRKYFSGGAGLQLTGVVQAGKNFSALPLRAQSNISQLLQRLPAVGVANSPIDITEVGLLEVNQENRALANAVAEQGQIASAASPIELGTIFAPSTTLTGNSILIRNNYVGYGDIESFLVQKLNLSEGPRISDVSDDIRNELRIKLGLEDIDIADFPDIKELGVSIVDLGKQPVFSFKPWIAKGILQSPAREIVLSTTGNQGRAAVWIAAKKYSITNKPITVKIFVGQNISEEKRAHLEELEMIQTPGVTVKIITSLDGENFANFDEASRAGIAYAQTKGDEAYYVHHADKEAILSYIALGDTIIDQYIDRGMDLNDAVIFVQVGAGGIAAGVAIAAKLRNVNTRVVLVQTNRTKHAYDSLLAGELLEYIDPSQEEFEESGIDTKKMERLAFEILAQLSDEMIIVNEKHLKREIGYFSEHGVRAEGAGVIPHLAIRARADALVALGYTQAISISTGSNISDKDHDEALTIFSALDGIDPPIAASSPIDGEPKPVAEVLNPANVTDDIHPYEASANAPWNVNDIKYDLARSDINYDALTEESVVAELSPATGVVSRLFLDELRARGKKIKKLVLIEVALPFWKAALNTAIRDIDGKYTDVVDEIEYRVLPKVDKVILMASDTIPELVGNVDLLLWDNAAHLVGNQLLPILESSRKLLKPGAQMVIGSGSFTREGLPKGDVYVDTPFEFVWQEIIKLLESDVDFNEFRSIWDGVSDEERQEAWSKAFETQVFPKKPPLSGLEEALDRAGFDYKIETPRMSLDKEGYAFFVLESKGMTEPATAPFLSLSEQEKNLKHLRKRGLPQSANEPVEDRIRRVEERIELLKRIERLDEKLAELRRQAYDNVWENYGQLNMAWTSIVATVNVEQAASSPVSPEYGGIDFNIQGLNLQIKRDGSGVPLPINLQPIETMHIDGFLPVIINIRPVTSLPLLTEVIDEQPIRHSSQENEYYPSPLAYLSEN